MPVSLTNQLHWMTCLWNVDSSLPVFRLNGISKTGSVVVAIRRATVHFALLYQLPRKFWPEQLAKVIGITPDGIKRQLDKMKKANSIKHVGPTKGGHWEIITE